MADIDKEVKVIVSAADQYSTQFAAFLGSLGGIGAALGVAVVAVSYTHLTLPTSDLV